MLAIAPAKAKVEEIVAKALDPVFKAEADIKAKIVDKVKEVTGPALASVQGKIDEQVQTAMPALLTASADELEALRESFAAVAAAGSDVASVLKALRHERYQNSWTWWGRNRKISNNLYDNVYVNNRSKDPYVFYRLAYDLIENYKDLNNIALKIAASEIETANPGDAATYLKQQVYPQIYAKFAHDLNVITHNALVRAIDDKIHDDVVKGIDKLLSPILEPIDSLIPDVAKDVINPKRTAMEIVDEVLSNTENQLVNAALNKFHEQTNALVASPPAI